MEYATLSDPTWLARFAGLAAMAASLLLACTILLMRLWTAWRGTRQRRVVAFWRPWLLQAVHDVPTKSTLPMLRQRDWLVFFHLWHNHVSSLRGEALENLDRLARRIGFNDIVLRLLDRPVGVRERLALLIGAGWLRDVRAWESLQHWMRHNDMLFSFASAHSLVRIDPRTALPEVLPLLLQRRDWPRNLVANMLMEAGPQQVSEPLMRTILAAPATAVASLLSYLRFVDTRTQNLLLFRFLPSQADPEIVTACLRVASTPKVLGLVRQLLQHDFWVVRVEAANTLGRIGRFEDVELLEPLVHDKEWWVRYRAAQAIANLPQVDLPLLRQLRERQTDRYASDILAQVIGEKE